MSNRLSNARIQSSASNPQPKVMQTQFDLSLADLGPRHPFHDDQRRLVINGEVSNTVVKGDKIDALYCFGSVNLLVTSYDYYDGVSHWFSILDRSGRILDMASTPDYFGFIEVFCPPPQDGLKFSFFGTNDVWQLHVNDKGAWSFSMNDILRRMNRYMLSKRHMFFRCEQGAPWIFQAQDSCEHPTAAPGR